MAARMIACPSQTRAKITKARQVIEADLQRLGAKERLEVATAHASGCVRGAARDAH